jgi:hypothetical protein
MSAMSSGRPGNVESGSGRKQWTYLVALTALAGLWTALMFAVAMSDESNESLPFVYYLALFGPLILVAYIAFGIARGAGTRRTPSRR